ncbi:LPXTG cell wall anchor domain-containing protein [Blautia wexlerae]|uniref:LPXTG cell wall anchor domain-containing protein n=1 Tax=Blautia wexlerae TaxID=418240 RepID=UPI001FB9E5BA|nr:LPXTG cell wall anchor domain-containing protein [Blautia wexlerae]
MRRKQLFAILMAGALSMGMAPSAAFAADTVAAQAEAEGELAAEEGTDAPAEDPAASETPTETPETPAEEPAETPDETPSEETPAETPETPSADPTEVPAAEEAGSGTIVIGETAYATLKEAFAAVPDSTAEANDPTYIKISSEIELGETIDVPANKNIMLVATAEDIKIKRAAGFAGSLFSVSGGTFQIAGGTVNDKDGNAIGTGSITVDGTGDGTTAVTAPMVDVQSGTFGISDGVTLSGNANTSTEVNGGAVNVASGAAFYLLGGTVTGNTAAQGGAVNAASGANVYLQGGTVTGNTAALGGGIYSEGAVNVKGTVSVTENKDQNDAASNLVLAGEGKINVTGATTGSTIGVQVKDAKAGVSVVGLAEGVTDVTLAEVLPQLTYEGQTFTIGEDGKLVDSTVTVTPTPSEKPEAKAAIKIESGKWTSHSSYEIKFHTNINGLYQVDWVKKGEKAPEITVSGQKIKADKSTTVTVTDLPDYDVDIYVTVISEKDSKNYKSVKVDNSAQKRPEAPVTPTPVPKTPAVTESKVQGFENALTFYPGTFYDFRAIGAGTDNVDPHEGDVRWVPQYWSMSANPSSKDMHTTWKIGAAKGIYKDAVTTYDIYVFFQKEVYSGTEWQAQSGIIESVKYQFKAAPLAQTSVTPGVTGSDGTYGGNGTAEGTSDLTPTTYADGTSGSASKSAVSTGDESPVGTMMALAAASILAGGYVLVRRRKKEM